MKRSFFRVKAPIILGALLGVALCGAVGSAAHAASLTVTNSGDNSGSNPAPGAATGTLRQAIIDANATTEADVITFAAGVGAQILLEGVLPVLNTNITITGPGAASLEVRRSTGGAYRIFTVADGVSVRISRLTISGGSVAGFGGGINNSGILTVAKCVFNNNSASKDGGALSNFYGSLNVLTCSFNNNSSGGSGGAIVSDARVDENGNSLGVATLIVLVGHPGRL